MNRVGYFPDTTQKGVSIDIGQIVRAFQEAKEQERIKAEKEKALASSADTLRTLAPNLFDSQTVETGQAPSQPINIPNPSALRPDGSSLPGFLVNLPGVKTFETKPAQIDPVQFVKSNPEIYNKIVTNLTAPQQGNTLIASLAALGENNKAEAIRDMFQKEPTPKNATPYVDPDGKITLIDTSNREASQKEIEGKNLVPYRQGTDRERSTRVVPDKTSSTGYRYNYYNDKTQMHDIPGQEAPQEKMQASERDYNRFDNLVKSADSDNIVKQYRNVYGAMPKIDRAYTDYNKTGNAAMLDDSLLYAINRMNDPNSVVMLGEYMRTAGLQSWWSGIKGNIGNITNDQAKISPEFRMKLYNAVTGALKDKSKAYDARMKYYRGRGTKYNNDSQEVKDAFPMSSEVLPENMGGASTPAPSGGGRYSGMSDKELLKALEGK